MKPRAVLLAIAAVAAGFPLAAAAQGKGMPAYEPQQRLRTALDACSRSEVMRDAYCVKKCATGFRMDFSGPRPQCIGLKADAKYTPPEPAYKPAPPNPARKSPSEGMG